MTNEERKVIELALEALEEPKEHIAKHRRLEAITAIKELLAQPEQEPVEWGVDWGKDGNSVSIIKRLADGNIEVLAWEYAPHPPQRPWVGLTDEEAQQAFKRHNCDISKDLAGILARAIEAQLKDKNHA